MKPGLLLVTISLFVWMGCTTSSEEIQMTDPGETQTGGPVEINIRNDSGVSFSRVVVTFPSQAEDYGAIDSGGESVYRSVEMAYRYAYIEAHAAEQTYVLQPFDYTGEKLLETGRYTYALSLTDGQLSLELIKQ